MEKQTYPAWFESTQLLLIMIFLINAIIIIYYVIWLKRLNNDLNSPYGINTTCYDWIGVSYE